MREDLLVLSHNFYYYLIHLIKFTHRFLHRRVPTLRSKVLLPVLYTGLLLWAMGVSTSRLVDNRHHWWDVLVGAIMGCVFSVWTVSQGYSSAFSGVIRKCLSRLYTHRSVPYPVPEFQGNADGRENDKRNGSSDCWRSKSTESNQLFHLNTSWNWNKRMINLWSVQGLNFSLSLINLDGFFFCVSKMIVVYIILVLSRSQNIIYRITKITPCRFDKYDWIENNKDEWIYMNVMLKS